MRHLWKAVALLLTTNQGIQRKRGEWFLHSVKKLCGWFRIFRWLERICQLFVSPKWVCVQNKFPNGFGKRCRPGIANVALCVGRRVNSFVVIASAHKSVLVTLQY